MFKKVIFTTLMLFSFNAFAAPEPIDTQFSEEGLEVHLLKVGIAHDVLTLVFAYDNQSEEDVEMLAIPIKEVFFNTKDQKFPVLIDEQNNHLASPIANKGASNNVVFTAKETSQRHVSFTVKAGKKKIAWVKFEAPKDDGWPLSFVLPGVTPFTINKPE